MLSKLWRNQASYMINDDDLKIATDGYRSKDKGAYCEDKHALPIPREGAVTTGQEEAIVGTVDQLVIPTVHHSPGEDVIVPFCLLHHLLSWHHGCCNPSTIRHHSASSKHHQAKFSHLQYSMQMLY